jgi:hypothetical protein
MNNPKQTLLAFYKLVFFLTETNKLHWQFDGRDSMITELPCQCKTIIRHFKNGNGNDVIDFDFTYSYFDKKHENILYRLDYRFRENNKDFKLYYCDYLYNTSFEKSKKKQISTDQLSPQNLLSELNMLYSTIRLGALLNEDQNPFNEKLLIDIYKHYLE